MPYFYTCLLLTFWVRPRSAILDAREFTGRSKVKFFSCKVKVLQTHKTSWLWGVNTSLLSFFFSLLRKASLLLFFLIWVSDFPLVPTTLAQQFSAPWGRQAWSCHTRVWPTWSHRKPCLYAFFSADILRSTSGSRHEPLKAGAGPYHTPILVSSPPSQKEGERGYQQRLGPPGSARGGAAAGPRRQRDTCRTPLNTVLGSATLYFLKLQLCSSGQCFQEAR